MVFLGLPLNCRPHSTLKSFLSLAPYFAGCSLLNYMCCCLCFRSLSVYSKLTGIPGFLIVLSLLVTPRLNTFCYDRKLTQKSWSQTIENSSLNPCMTLPILFKYLQFKSQIRVNSFIMTLLIFVSIMQSYLNFFHLFSSVSYLFRLFSISHWDEKNNCLPQQHLIFQYALSSIINLKLKVFLFLVRFQKSYLSMNRLYTLFWSIHL